MKLEGQYYKIVIYEYEIKQNIVKCIKECITTSRKDKILIICFTDSIFY